MNHKLKFGNKFLLGIIIFLVNSYVYSQEWTWIKGPNTINATGVYGTQGSAAVTNMAGSREGAATWTDASGNLWMFGGNGHSSSTYGRLNDLWKWDPSTSQWTWVKGQDAIDQWANYGTLGTASVTNNPGSRAYASTWLDNSGDLWMFGGFGYDASGNIGDLNDLWKYTIASNNWTWMGGSNIIHQNGAYGTLGVASSTNIPGARRAAATWKDASGNLCLFGGYGFPASGGAESGLNDFWKYNIAGNTWTWVHGTNMIDQFGVYGTQGLTAAANTPGTRFGCSAWRDNSGNLWLFGGSGYSSANQGYMNDVWKFNTSTNQWTWMKGSNLSSAISVFGTQTVPSTITTPGGRQYAASWSDANGNLIIFGGYGISTNSLSAQNLNDVWKFDVNSNNWLWVRGATYEIIGNYGTQGVAAVSNDPGSGYVKMSWKDNSGNLWLFGGYGYDVNGNYGLLSELWKMNPCLPAAPVSVSSYSNQNACSGVSATLSVVSHTNSISWYSAPTGGTALTTGTTYITPVLSSGTAATTSYTYYASSTNTCGNSSVRSPIIVTSNNINPTVTTGPTQFTVTHYIGSGQTPNSSWSPWTYNFTDPLPVGAIITGVGITCDAVDQGWGGTGAGLDIRLAGTRIAIPVLYHSPQNFVLGNTNPFAGYNYGGTNTFELYFVGWGGWQAFMTNATLTFSYQTKTPAAITACQNSSLTLKGYGATTYSWSGGVTDNVPFALASTQIYTVTGANIYGCINTATQLVNVNPSPTVAISGNTAICQGSSLSQTATINGASHTFSWNTGASSTTISSTPTISTTYFATASNTLTGCSHSMSRKVKVNAIPLVTVNSNTSTVCSGQSVSLSVNSNTLAYALNFDGTDDYIETNANITELGNSDFSIEVWIKTTGSSQGLVVCNDANTTWDSGEKALYLNSSGVPVFVGFGNNYIIGASSVNDGTWHHVAVVWDHSSGTSGIGKIYVDGVDNTTTSNFVATTANLGTFKFGYTNFNGYTPEAPNYFTGSMDDIRIWNTARSSSQIASNINTCLSGTEYGLKAYYTFEDGPGSVSLADASVHDFHGTLVNMNTSGSWIQGKANCVSSIASYVWMPGSLSSSSVSVTPPVSTDYSVTVTNNFGCSGVGTRSVHVNPSPTITVNSGSVCIGSSFSIVPAGAASYVISGGSTVVSPTVNSNYSVTGVAASGCVSSNTAIASVFVNNLPILSISGPTAVCDGASVTETVSGANTYSWSTGSTSPIVTLSPTLSTNYSVTGTNTVTGCVNSISRYITVGTIPVITVNSGNICQGQSFTLSPSGASTYTFASSAGFVSSVVSPSVNTSYFVSGTSSLGCVSTSSAISNVVVNLAPVISVNSGGVCAGKVFTMVPSGASTYTFSNGSSTVIPTSNTNYSVSGTTILGCVSLVPGIASVTVNAVPVVSAANGTVCNGSTYSIIASGAQTYTYFASSGQTSSLVTPASTTNYSVTGTSSAGCVASNTAVITVSAVALPVITVNSSTVCSGTVFTITPAGAATYTYSGGSSTVIPFSNTSYSVTGTSSAGCVSANAAVASLTVLVSPVVSVNSGAICAGKVFTIIPSGAQTYTYSGNSTTVSPLASTNYSVTGTSSQGCLSSNIAVSTVIVNALPQLTINGTSVICQGETSNLLVTGASTFTWNNGANGPILMVLPSVSTNYTVNGTGTNGCTNFATFLVTVNALPTITVNSGTICSSGSFTMIPAGGLTYTYSSGSSVVSPASTTSYTVVGTDSNGCVSNNPAVSTVSVNTNLNLSVSGSTLVCSGSTATLVANGATTYSWNTGSTTSTLLPTPTINTVYSVIGSDGACTDSAFIFVQVNNLPVVQLKPISSIVCQGETLTLTASGALSYTWSNMSNSTSLSISPSVTSVYSVSGSDVNGCMNSAAVTVTVNECLGEETLIGSTLSELKIFPNPNNGTFIIQADQVLTLCVRNNLGQLVFETELQAGENEIKMEVQAKGVYYASIKQPGFQKTYKIIKH